MVRQKGEASSRASTSDGEKFNTHVLVNTRRAIRRQVRVLNEIWYMKSSIKLLISIPPFKYIVRKILMNLCPAKNIIRLQANALKVLQEAAEAYIIQFFEDCTLLSMHTKRELLKIQDEVISCKVINRCSGS